MPLKQSYTVPFSPPPNFGNGGRITIQPNETGESVMVTIGDSDGSVSWSMPDFDQLERDLGEARTLLGTLSAQKMTKGSVYRVQVGQWLEIVCHDNGWYCNIGGTAAQFRQEAELATIVRGLPGIRKAVDEALATFRRLRK